MRLCVLTTSYPRSSGDDAGIFVERLVAALAEPIESVTVVVPHDDTEAMVEVRGKVDIRRFRYGLWRRGRLAFGLGIAPNIAARPLVVFQIPGLLLGMFRCAARLRARTDVILANWISAGLIAYSLRRFFGIPYVIVLRGGDVRLVKAFPRLFRPVFRAARGVVAVSESLRAEIRDVLPDVAAGTTIIHNGVTVRTVAAEEVQRFLSKRGLRQERYLLFVGSVIPRKRIEDLVELLAVNSLSDYELVVCGRIGADAYRREILERARALGVGARVRFEGLVPPDEIALYLAGAAAYISAAEFEGRPNGLLEAMVVGLPCVVSDIPPHRELIEDGKSGVLFSLLDREGVAQRLATLLRSPDECARLGAEAKVRVSAQTWERCAEQYLSILDSEEQDVTHP